MCTRPFSRVGRGLAGDEATADDKYAHAYKPETQMVQYIPIVPISGSSLGAYPAFHSVSLVPRIESGNETNLTVQFQCRMNISRVLVLTLPRPYIAIGQGGQLPPQTI